MQLFSKQKRANYWFQQVVVMICNVKTDVFAQIDLSLTQWGGNVALYGHMLRANESGRMGPTGAHPKHNVDNVPAICWLNLHK